MAGVSPCSSPALVPLAPALFGWGYILEAPLDGVWAQEPLPRAESGGSRVLPVPSSLIWLIAKQRKPRTGTVPGGAGVPRAAAGRRAGALGLGLAVRGGSGWSAAADPQLRRGNGEGGSRPIHSQPPQRGAPSPAYLPQKLHPATPSSSFYLHRGLRQPASALNGPDAITEPASICSSAAKRAVPPPAAIYHLSECRVRPK